MWFAAFSAVLTPFYPSAYPWLVFVGKVLHHQGLLCRVFLTQLIYNPFLTPQMMSIMNPYFRFLFPFPSQWFFSITSTLKFVFQMPSEWFPCLPSYYSLWCSSFCGFYKFLPHKLLLYCSHCFTYLFLGSQLLGKVLTPNIFLSIHLWSHSCPSSNKLLNSAVVANRMLASGQWLLYVHYNLYSNDVKSFAVRKDVFTGSL